jgi:uncharacterized flavoprotein (TIGR03862 family)
MPEEFWLVRIAEFGPGDSRVWAAGLGVKTFAASTGRVYPEEMKAAPLLRAWVQRLRRSGVHFAVRYRWTGWRGEALAFETPTGPREVSAAAVILALGGGSWPETGADGAWTEILARRAVAIAPLEPANCGWEVAWPAEVLAKAEGRPLKNVVVTAGAEIAAGELLITRYGLEGGAIYQLGAALRAMARPEIRVDFKPGVTAERLVAKLGPARRNLALEAARRWKLGPGAAAILEYCAPAECLAQPHAIARAVKDFPIALRGPRPLREAISSAGGVRWSEVDEGLMLRRLPGVFVAGEMIDWEAPTGGYLMQGCFATGAHAARSAVAWMRNARGGSAA